MKTVLALFLCAIHLGIQAQFDIKWSELMPNKGHVISVLPISYSDFYTTRFVGGSILNSTFLSKHSNFSVTSKGKITAKLENGFGQVELIAIVNNTPTIFISDKKEGQNTLYFQKYSITCQALGLPKKIASYHMPKAWKRKGNFWVHQSENKDFFVVDYEIPGNKEEKDRFGYVIYSNEFEKISEGEYELPYDADKVTITNNYLSNTGDYFLAAKVYKTNDSKKIFKSRLNLDKIVLMQVSQNGVEEFDLALKNGKFISDLTFSSDNNRMLTFTGLYSDKGYSSVKGVFFFKLDFNKKTMLNEGWEEFSQDFITSDWSDKAKRKAEKNVEKGKEAELYEYDIREIQTLKDGSIVGMLEQYFIRVISSSDSRENARTTTYYYYNDVIIYRVNPSGKFEWVKKIQKYQVSTNDDGFYSSIASFHTNDKLVLMFNDNLKNYTISGNFIDDNNRFFPTSYRKNSNCVAKVEVNLVDGAIDRMTFFDQKHTKAYAVPKKFSVDYTRNEMLLVLMYGKKEKYGVLSF